MLNTRLSRLVTAVAAVFATLAMGANARTTVGGPLDLAGLVAASDVICEAQVAEAETKWVDRRIVTTYSLEVQDYLLGAGPEAFEMTVLGGETEDPPIGMTFDGMVVMSSGQRAVLFLRDATEQGPPALTQSLNAGVTPAYGENLMPVRGEEGVYTILTSPTTGEEFAFQINYSVRGVSANQAVNERVINSLEQTLGQGGLRIASPTHAHSHAGMHGEEEAAPQPAPGILPLGDLRSSIETLIETQQEVE